jgi:rRNA maturation RNase YbeY
MTVEFVYNTDYKLDNEQLYCSWLAKVALSEGYTLKNIVYAFFNDKDIKSLNIKFLNHNYYTDVLSFDDSDGYHLKGNIAVSIDRVRDNSKKYSTKFDDELRRVMVHGLLHFMGYNDSNNEEINVIRAKEEKMLRLFHVKQ